MVTIVNVYRKFIYYKPCFREKRTSVNSVFVNPMKFRKILFAGKNGVIHCSINSISFTEMSTERNK